ncbi:MAG TPA: hypothetical protein ENJ56_06710, partial [Anaerolineae bacterium]|nr:hypothetical protein [Anaerolineae bacterium]
MHWKKIQLPLIILLLIGFLTSKQQIANTASTNLHTLSTSANRIEFELNSTPATITDGRITIDGIDSVLQQAGAPMLPYYTAIVALPPLADVSATLATANISERVVANITPAATIVETIGRAEDLHITGLEELTSESIPDAAIYGKDDFYPANWYEISEPLQSRDLRYVIVKIFPARFNPVTKQLQQAESLRFALDFVGGSAEIAQPLALPAQQSLAKTMLNPAQALQWGHMP